MIDGDNRLAIQEICTRNGKTISIEELGKWTLVEQHKDAPDRAHIYIISEKPFPTKASDKGKPSLGNKIATNEIPAIEVKSVGGLAFAWNSMHQDGCRYEFVDGELDRGVKEKKAALCDVFKEHINSICKKYGLQYLDENGKGVGHIPIAELFKPDTIIYEGNNRHLELLRATTSLIRRNKDILSLEEIKQISMNLMNLKHCGPPLDDKEFNRIFNQATDEVLENNSKQRGEKGYHSHGSSDNSSSDDYSHPHDNSSNTSSTHIRNIINLCEYDIEEIMNLIVEYCNHSPVQPAPNDNQNTTPSITTTLSWILFKDSISLDSSERLIRNLSKVWKEEEVEAEARIKDLRDVYLKGHNEEGIPDEHILLQQLEMLADAQNLSSGSETANELLNKIKKVFRRRRNDALSLLPEYVRNELPEYICEELQTNVVEVLSPTSFYTKSLELVVAHLSHKKIRYATIYIEKKKMRKVNPYPHDIN
jgi:hypothetical protein